MFFSPSLKHVLGAACVWCLVARVVCYFIGCDKDTTLLYTVGLPLASYVTMPIWGTFIELARGHRYDYGRRLHFGE